MSKTQHYEQKTFTQYYRLFCAFIDERNILFLKDGAGTTLLHNHKKQMTAMKELLITTVLFLFTSTLLISQTPQSFKYQAVARNAQLEPLANQEISIRFSIIKDNSGGSIIYSEEHHTTTGNEGLFSLNIGEGIQVSGNFNDIQWGAHIYFLRVEMDADGISGSLEFQLMGESQLMAVPYALHASTVENDQVDDADANPTNELITGGTLNGSDLEITDAGGTTTIDLSALANNIGANTYNIGDLVHGGIVFWVDESGEHGLVAGPSDLNIDVGFPSSVINNYTRTDRDGIYAGKSNTIINSAPRPFIQTTYPGSTTYKLITNGPTNSESYGLLKYYLAGGYGDWYIPSRAELQLLYTNLHLAGLGSFQQGLYGCSTAFFSITYPLNSSNEILHCAWNLSFSDGSSDSYCDPGPLTHFRPIRAF
jgi:hypothetical protein